MITRRLVLSIFTYAALRLWETNALSVKSEAANLARGRLQEALSSLSKKITISPEIIIPEPSDPTALLLQATEVTKLSHGIRNNAKGNAAFLSGSINAIKAFCAEQETARGSFPGPLPVIYCEPLDETDTDAQLEELAEVGVSGVLYTLVNGNEITSHDDLKNDSKLESIFQCALDHGVQLIPEVILSTETEWDENKTKDVINNIIHQCGSDSEPVAILLSVGKEMDEEEMKDTKVPIVPKVLPSIIGSVRAVAGGGRIGSAVQAHKESGFNGVILRCDCLPGYRMNPDLDFVKNFWGAAIGDLKSTKSKNFNFRSKVALERDIPMEWFKYQKSVMESGALGGNDPGANPLDSANGDYQGF